MVVNGRDGLLLYERKEQGQAPPKSRATASRLFRTFSQIVCSCMTHHREAQPLTDTAEKGNRTLRRPNGHPIQIDGISCLVHFTTQITRKDPYEIHLSRHARIAKMPMHKPAS